VPATLAKVKTLFSRAELVAISRIINNNGYFYKSKLWQPFLSDLFLCVSSILLAILAIFSLNANGRSGWDLYQFIPGGAWTLAGWLNWGLIKEMFFKTVVLGGFILQNRTRLLLLAAVLLAAIYGSSKKAAAPVSKAAAGLRFFKLRVNELVARLDLRPPPAWNHLSSRSYNSPQCC
jgi:hypothetical protein